MKLLIRIITSNTFIITGILLLAVGVVFGTYYLANYNWQQNHEENKISKTEEKPRKKWTYENVEKVICPEGIYRKIRHNFGNSVHVRDTSYIVIYTDSSKRVRQLELWEDEITFWITTQTKVDYSYTIATDEIGNTEIWNRKCNIQLRNWNEIKRWE